MVRKTELAAANTLDGGTWGQPFLYKEIAHLIIPRRFQWVSSVSSQFVQTEHRQDVDAISAKLEELSIPHELSGYALQVRLF